MSPTGRVPEVSTGPSARIPGKAYLSLHPNLGLHSPGPGQALPDYGSTLGGRSMPRGSLATGPCLPVSPAGLHLSLASYHIPQVPETWKQHRPGQHPELRSQWEAFIFNPWTLFMGFRHTRSFPHMSQDRDTACTSGHHCIAEIIVPPNDRAVWAGLAGWTREDGKLETQQGQEH